jgi:hypothetical protein
MALSFNDVNRRNSFTWIKCNDDAKSVFFRNTFVAKYGGEFVKNGRYWEWKPKQEEMIELNQSIIEEPVSENEPSKTWSFKNPNGDIVKTQNLQEFCKENNLTRSSLYEVISGKRQNHKGYSFIEITKE